MSTAANVLVIGYGNPLRRDDGIGPFVASEIEERRMPGVRTIVVHQLTPELAEELAEADLVIFVDARVDEGHESVGVYRLEPGGTRCGVTHVVDPRGLLTLSMLVYERTPEAWLVSIAGTDFGVGEGLSGPARRRVDAALNWIEQRLEQPRAGRRSEIELPLERS